EARVALARDVYDRLRQVTGAADPALVQVGTPAFNALRWLAQLAVNVVDYVDGDDYLTPFDWFADAQGTRHYVFGTELPRVVLNEADVEIANDPSDPGLLRENKKATRDFIINFWVELLNPFARDPARVDHGAARLQVPFGGEPGYAIYQVVIARTPNPLLYDPANVLGEPNPSNVRLVVNRFNPDPNGPPPDVDPGVVEPVDGRDAGAVGKNQGFYVLGPIAGFPGTDPAAPFATLRVEEQVIGGYPNAMSYRFPKESSLTQLPDHAIFLRRLAWPHLPPHPAPGGAFNLSWPYNPYITVDYMGRVPTNDAVVADADGAHAGLPVNQRFAYGRVQPYAASPLMQVPQRLLGTPTGQPHHSFFRHNQP